MRIAFCHNFYKFPGGEDRVFHDESDMMEEAGHDVFRYTRHNDEVDSLGRFKLLKKTVWNREVYNELKTSFQKFEPDVVHFQNTFPLISAAGYKAAKDCGAAVVQTLHNYRFICPNANLTYQGEICERCVGKTFATPSISRKCYRDSRAATSAIVMSNAWHRLRGTANRYVDRFIALTGFCKAKFVEGGFSADQVVVKPNFVRNPPVPLMEKNGQACFVGRLTREKGIETVLNAWKKTNLQLPLQIAGDGPLRPLVEQAAAENPLIHYLGQLPHQQVLELTRNSSLQLVPSQYYEPFGLVVIEAFGAGTPVVASNIGSLAELIDHQTTGMHFPPGNANELADFVLQLMDDKKLYQQIQQNALNEFQSKYTKQQNYQMLSDLYQKVIQ